tara:strand:+ start:1179 stop:1451 length:273 start_codon:yes stop_codon:yes gene_type:complete
MKVGDLVRHRSDCDTRLLLGNHAGIVVDIVQKKCWRTSERGTGVDWNKVEPEAHAVVLLSRETRTRTIPVIDLEVVVFEDYKETFDKIPL